MSMKLAIPDPYISSYDRIGFASGIYYSKLQKQLLKFAEEKLPDGKETFFVYTYGAEKKGYTVVISEAVKNHNSKILGECGCFGFGTFGPFKLIGSIAKGHTDDTDIKEAVEFCKSL